MVVLIGIAFIILAIDLFDWAERLDEKFSKIPCLKCGSLRTKVLYETQHPYCKEGVMMKHYECKKCGYRDGI